MQLNSSKSRNRKSEISKKAGAEQQKKSGYIQNKVALIIALFSLLTLAILGLVYVQSEAMNGVRAYVRGEGSWAKGQKDAVYYLQKYTLTKRPADYQSFIAALDIPLGDRKARIALKADPIDRQAAVEGFLAGNNQAEDVDSMIDFFLRFQNVRHMREAIIIWEEADTYIFKIKVLGEEVRSAVLQQDFNQVAQLFETLEQINKDVTAVEYQFSHVLSEGARWVKNTLLWVIGSLIFCLLLLLFLLSSRLLRAIRHRESELRISENRFLGLYRSDMLGIFEWHKDGDIMDANPAFLKMIGHGSDKIDANASVNWKKLTPSQWQECDRLAFQQILDNGYCQPYEKEYKDANGSLVPVSVGGALLANDAERGIAFVIDRSKRAKAEEELRLSATVFNASSNGIIITDKDFNVISVNQTYLEFCGYSRDELRGKLAPMFSDVKLSPSIRSEMQQALKSQGHWQIDIIEECKKGTQMPVLLSVNCVYDRHQELINHVLVVTDIGERKAMENHLKQQAYTDYLTGLPNRNLFNDRLEQALIRAGRNDSILALLFIDLDKFKPVNDQCGHQVGDKILQVIGKRLKQSVREQDTVSRLGGDEFTVILEDLISAKDAAIIAEKIIQQINKPITIEQYNLTIECSIGIAICPQDGSEKDNILSLADSAMYKAKKTKPNSFSFYNQA